MLLNGLLRFDLPCNGILSTTRIAVAALSPSPLSPFALVLPLVLVLVLALVFALVLVLARALALRACRRGVDDDDAEARVRGDDDARAGAVEDEVAAGQEDLAGRRRLRHVAEDERTSGTRTSGTG